MMVRLAARQSARDSRLRGVMTVVASIAIALVTLVPAWAQTVPPIDSTRGFRKGVTLAGIRQHQQVLQQIATANGGNRLAGTEGYDDSAQYVYDKLQAAGYNPEFQEFTFLLNADRTPPVLERVSPNPKTYVDGVDFASMTYSGNGDVTASVTAVDIIIHTGADNTSNSGCEATDFAGFPAGSIALMQRGTCSFRAKADNATAAGASAAIIFNEGNNAGRTGVIFGTLAPPATVAAIPVVGTSFAAGDELRGGVTNGPTGVTAHVKVDRTAETATTHNVIAETPTGNPNRVVVVGAHLDSVSRGPGINDNGSGSGMILEIAEVFAAQGRVADNKIRFAWWGAEELGLIGSTFYVNSLSEAEQDQILLNLNFDMVGSPNFVRFVYDGNNSTFPVGPGVQPGPAGSGAIEQIFLDYFAAMGLPNEPTPFNGRSDYGPFIAEGIPAGGLFTGAEGLKTAAQATTYGGTAGQQYDPCYHLACDTFANVSLTALDQMSDAAAHTVLVLSKHSGELTDP
jgi:Zn-dependent M28 family amino/carboxypeptidase